jgi:hypothetical protein
MISVPFPAGSGATKLVFPDQPQLRGAKVHGIELVFSVIDHIRVDSAFVDGFVTWKHKLNERLV